MCGFYASCSLGALVLITLGEPPASYLRVIFIIISTSPMSSGTHLRVAHIETLAFGPLLAIE